MKFILALAILLSIPVLVLSAVDSGSISGVVVSGGGTPVGDARVCAIPADRPINGRIPNFPADGQGRFRIGGLSPGRYSVIAFKLSEGYPDPGVFAFFATDRNHFPTVTVEAGRVTETTVNLGLKAGRLSIRVLDGRTGRPVTSAGMELVRRDDPQNSLSTGARLGDDPGTVWSWVPPLTPFSIRISADGYASWSTEDEADPALRFLQLQPQEERVLVVKLEPRATGPGRPR